MSRSELLEHCTSLFPMSEAYYKVLEHEDKNREKVSKRIPGTARSSTVGRLVASAAHEEADYQPGLHLPV